jgi:hypothetical protein
MGVNYSARNWLKISMHAKDLVPCCSQLPRYAWETMSKRGQMTTSPPLWAEIGQIGYIILYNVILSGWWFGT